MSYDELYFKAYKLIQGKSYQDGLSILFEIQYDNADAKFLLAYFYEVGIENLLDKNLNQAIEIYQELISLKQNKALYNLGMLFLRSAQYEDAETYLKKSSASGNCSASYWLYRIYSENIFNEIEMNKYLEISNNQGHLQAKRDFLIKKRNNEESILKKIKLTLQIIILKITAIPIILKDPMDEKLS